MAKRDTLKTSKYSVGNQEWALDINPHKSTKKAKARERQMGKKLIREELGYADIKRKSRKA